MKYVLLLAAILALSSAQSKYSTHLSQHLCAAP